jgi:hypothetical protein
MNPMADCYNYIQTKPSKVGLAGKDHIASIAMGLVGMIFGAVASLAGPRGLRLNETCC